jgi:hypothetical protein
MPTDLIWLKQAQLNLSACIILLIAGDFPMLLMFGKSKGKIANHPSSCLVSSFLGKQTR